MTCIVGLRTEKVVWIGGDSAGTADNFDQSIRRDPKVFFVGSFLIGISGSYRLGAALHYSFRPPHLPRKGSLLAYLNTAFVDAVRKLAKSKGFLEKDDEDGVDRGNKFLVGYGRSLFCVDECFAVYEPIRPYEAIGCGDNQALGSLYSSYRIEDPKARVLEALHASEAFCAAVRKPFVVWNT